MSKKFAKLPIAVGSRSKQNLSATTYLTQDFGRLSVLYHTEVCPNDDINLDVSQFMRMAPLCYPTHGSIRHDIRVFFVPNRILTKQPKDAATNEFSWDNYITGVSNNAHPYLLGTNIKYYLNTTGHLDADGFYTSVKGTPYEKDCRRLISELGLPEAFYQSLEASDDGIHINPFAFAAYQRIWWDYYRDSNLISEQEISKFVPTLVTGSNSTLTYKLLVPRYACFQKDYFTTAKLYPQSGSDASVARVDVATSLNPSIAATNSQLLGVTSDGLVGKVASSGSSGYPSIGSFNSSPNSVIGQLQIEVLRRANALQKYLERNNIVGSRLIERFLARFGVSPTSEQLQMCEYLGGSSKTYDIGSVMSSVETATGSQTAASDAFGQYMIQGGSGSIQGSTSGAGAVQVNSGNVKYHAKEFGTLMVIGSIVPNVIYTDGLRRSWSRGVLGDRFEYLTPEFDRLGYEPIYQQEIYHEQNTNSYPFGFVPRYQSYKYQPSVKAGDLVLRGTNAFLDVVAIDRSFDEPPTLNREFTMIEPHNRYFLDKMFQIQGNSVIDNFDHFMGYAHCECIVTRSLSDDGMPALDPDLDDSKKKILVENGGIRF